jgi:hypothetical protein
MEKQKSAVEWLVEQLDGERHLTETEINRVIAKAKEMEKEQKEKDFIEGYKAKALASNLIFDKTSELFAKELFNKTFKS